MIDNNKLNAAIKAVEERKSNHLRCPECGKAAALLTLSFKHLHIATLCRFCNYTQYAKGSEEEKHPRGGAKVVDIQRKKVATKN